MGASPLRGDRAFRGSPLPLRPRPYGPGLNPSNPLRGSVSGNHVSNRRVGMAKKSLCVCPRLLSIVFIRDYSQFVLKFCFQKVKSGLCFE
jgi:hypothetical protein